MDPPSLINGVGGGGPGEEGGAFPIPGAGPPNFNLAEIWPFQLNGGHAAPFGHGGGAISPYCNGSGVNHEAISDGGLLSLEQRVSPGGGGRKRRDFRDDSVKGGASTSNGDALLQNDCDLKRLKTSGDDNVGGDGMKPDEAGPSSAKAVAKPQESPKQDYIHVRARRGQATDSHSLAERARREKISERMKILQDLVPGCNKVIGKALVLDEIINYIQSLQRQVEFLSMKLEAVNSRLTPGLEVFPSKDFGQQSFDTGAIPFVSQAPREYSRGSSPDWLHMQIGGSLNRRT